MDEPATQATVNADEWDRIDNMLNALTGLGGFQDKGASARPNVFGRTPLLLPELYALYLDNGIARKVVDIIPREAVRNGWTVTDDTTDPDAITQENERLQVEVNVCDAMKWARLLGGGIIVMVTEDDIPPEFADDPDTYLAEPLDLDRVIRLKRLEVFDADDAIPIEYGHDIEEEGFREPLMWSVAHGGVNRIHRSRVLWFRGAKRPTSLRFHRTSSSNAVDDSILQAGWNEIRNLTTTMQAGATLAQELREAVMKISGMANLNTAQQSEKMRQRLQLIAISKGVLGLTVLAEGDSYENRGNPPTGFKELSEPAKQMVSAVFDIPITQLFGESAGGLGGDGGTSEEGFDRKIHGEQKLMKPQLRQLYEVIYAAKEGPTKGLIPETWDITFNPLKEQTEKEKAEVRKTTMETDTGYIQWGVLDPKTVTRGRYGEAGYKFELPPEKEVEEVDMIAALAEMERADGVPVKAVIWTPLSEAGIALSESARARASEILGEELVLPDTPHVTVLFLGPTDSDGLDQIKEVIDQVAANMAPVELSQGRVVTFPAGAIVIEYQHIWHLEGANNALLRALADRVEAPQFPTFRAHTTIGNATRELTPDELSALTEIQLGDERWVAAELQLVTEGGTVVHRAAMTGQQ